MSRARTPHLELLPERSSRAPSFTARIERALSSRALALPDWALSRLAGPLVERDGNLLDRQAQAMLRLARAVGPKPLDQLSVARARATLEATSSLLAPPLPPLASVRDARISTETGDLGARVYRPLGAPEAAPALVYFHGGGWVTGSLDTHDVPCRVLAAETPCVLISIDYRLAPEHPFPAAVDDAIAAFRAVVALASQLGIDPARVAVGGDSAGGNLAAVVARETRGDALRAAYQLLVYPVTDATMSTPSYRSCGEGFFLERATMAWFLSHYVPRGTDLADPRLSPLAADDCGDLPPGLLVTAGFDPLRDEGVAYAAKLARAGVALSHRSYDTLIHGFLNLSGGVRAAKEPLDDLARGLSLGLARAS